MRELIGETIGRYHVISLIGKGGMAAVYLAEDTLLGRKVAIKIILPEQQQSAVFIKRFEREAKTLAQLSNPNIVKVLDYGELDGFPYLVMEYIGGGTLSQRLGEPIPWPDACAMLLPIARALEVAHRHKLVHRDIKPSNILLNEVGQPMLSDFGIVKILENDETQGLTAAGVAIGTTSYMSPEQAQGKEVDGRSDIYSLGVVLFEMVTGQRPFVANTPVEVTLKHITEPVPRPRLFVRELPLECEQTIFKAMAKKPEDRYADMGEFARALESGADSRGNKSEPRPTLPSMRTEPRPITGPRTPISQPAIAAAVSPKKGVKLPVILGVTGALIILLAAAFFFIFRGNGILPATQTPTRPKAVAALPTHTKVPTVFTPQPPTATLPQDTPTSTQTPTQGPTQAATSTPLAANLIRLSNVDTLAELNHYGQGAAIQVAWAPDSSLIAVASGRGITFLKPTKLESAWVYNADTVVSNVLFYKDGNSVIFTTGATINFLDYPSRKIKSSYNLQSTINSLAISPDASLLSAGMPDSKVILVNVFSGVPTHTLRSNYGGWGTTFSPDGRLVAVASSQGALMWVIDTNSWIPLATGQNDLMKSVAFSHNSTFLVAGGKNIIRVWRVDTGAEVFSKTGNLGTINTLTFSLDDSAILAGADDGTIRCFNTTTGDLRREIHAYNNAIYSIQLSPDGTRLVTGENDGFVRLWGLP